MTTTRVYRSLPEPKAARRAWLYFQRVYGKEPEALFFDKAWGPGAEGLWVACWDTAWCSDELVASMEDASATVSQIRAWWARVSEATRTDP